MDTLSALLSYLVAYVLIGLAIATASITLTRARIFEPFRGWAERQNYLLYKLVSCPYCMSHWLALWVVPYALWPATEVWLADALITWFALTGTAALLEGLMMNWLHMQENLIQGLEDDLAYHRDVIKANAREHVKTLEQLQEKHLSEQDSWIAEGRRQERDHAAEIVHLHSTGS